MKIVVYLILSATCVLVVNSDEENEGEGVIRDRFYRQRNSEGQSCEVRNRVGVCKQRGKCKFPTSKRCQRGINPIVCCMDETSTAPGPTRIKTTPLPKRITTRRPTTQKEDLKSYDIVYPDCGTRRPQSPPTTPAPGRRGGLFGGRRRLGRRKRFAQNRELTGLFNSRGIQPVIVGGITAKPNSWPWMVAVFKKVGGNFRFLCGASLISRKYILTAAHCFTKNEINAPSRFMVKVGAHTTSDGTSYPIESIEVHPKYKDKMHYYDIALLQVKDVTLGSKVHPVCLPSESLRSKIGSTKKNVTVVGWGDTSFGGASSKRLQEVELPLVPVKRCNESYYKIASQVFPEGINDLFMCAGFKDGGKDACQGDSGGPLTMEMEGGRYVQLGIVSFGVSCAQPDFPGVYTRVSQFAKWLHDNTDLGQVSRT